MSGFRIQLRCRWALVLRCCCSFLRRHSTELLFGLLRILASIQTHYKGFIPLTYGFRKLFGAQRHAVYCVNVVLLSTLFLEQLRYALLLLVSQVQFPLLEI